MPEEINRLVTDQLSDLLFTPSVDGDENLMREGISREKIHFVGNVMIDTLVRLLPLAKQTLPKLRDELGLDTKFLLVTLHRPSNVDDRTSLLKIFDSLENLGRDAQIIFPVHPRTRKLLADLQLQPSNGIRMIQPLGYLEFLALQTCAVAVVTDSGGIQEETTYLGTPCLTLRESTERPVTISNGTNVLIGHDFELLLEKVDEALAGNWKKGTIPELWDGKAGERIAKVLLQSRKS
jgi:UDP-N-acetylglucosamine 2-epimerase (non-hydrolysing)